MSNVDRPLSGIRIIGLEQYMAGPYCTMLLADAGAEVIKIERPGTGDPRRMMPPFAEKDGNKKAAGCMTAYGILQALYMRERTGEGQLVDSAMFDNMLSLNEQMVTMYSIAGQVGERGKLTNYYPRGAFQTKDGYLALHCPDNILWQRLERPDLKEDERSVNAPARCANTDFLDPIINGFLSSMTRDEAVAKLNGAGVPCGPVNTAVDIFEDPHVKARGMLMDIDDPDVGSFKFTRTTPHLSSAPELPKQAAPRLGQHTREILSGLLGRTDGEIDALAADGVVGTDDS